MGIHRGYLINAQVKYCINHGEPNPKSKYPDSFCGKPFLHSDDKKDQPENEPCKTHTGFYKVKNKKTGEGIWSCCQEEARDGPTCQEGDHAHANYPEDEAKKYFFDRPLKDPSQTYMGKQAKGDFELCGRFSGFFRSPEPYEPILFRKV